MLPVFAAAPHVSTPDWADRLEEIDDPEVRTEIRRLAENDPTLTELALRDKWIDNRSAQVLALTLAQNRCLTTFDLRGKYIDCDGVQTLAPALAQNRCLTSLSLHNNQIGESGAQAMAEALAQNGCLTTFDLSSNHIGDNGAQALAKALAQNGRLTLLNLHYNWICDSGAQALACVLGQNRCLTTLDLSFNEIGARGTQGLAEALAQNGCLTSLNLGYNKLDASGAQALAKALAQNGCLTSLDLGSNKIGDSGAQALAEALAQNRCLRTLDLRCNFIFNNGAQTLADALKQNACLTSLDLGHNRIGPSGARALADALAQNGCLTSLDLGHNMMISDSGAQALAEALAQNHCLTTFDLGGNHVGDNGAQTLADALGHGYLTSLDLSSNHIGDNGAQALAKVLAQNCCLTTLDLGFNKIGASGARALSVALAQNDCLTTLDLGWNQIGASGALVLVEELIGASGALAMALAQNRCLTTLDLGHNQLGARGVQPLASVLAQNGCLTTLRLGDNQIGASGAQALAGALSQNGSLTSLYLDSYQIGKDNNQIGDSGAQALAGALAQNRCLTRLDLDGDKIDNSGAQRAIKAALTRNEKAAKAQSQTLFLQGQQYAAAGDVQQAAERFRQALRLGIGYLDRKPIQAALDPVQKQLKQADQHAKSGQAHLQAQRYEQAQAAFAQALAICRDHASAQKGLQLAREQMITALRNQLEQEAQWRQTCQARHEKQQATLNAQVEGNATKLADNAHQLEALHREAGLAARSWFSWAKQARLQQRIAELEQDKTQLTNERDALQTRLVGLALRVELLAQEQEQTAMNTPKTTLTTPKSFPQLQASLRRSEKDLINREGECRSKATKLRRAMEIADQAEADLLKIQSDIRAQGERIALQQCFGLTAEASAFKLYLGQVKRLCTHSPPSCFISYAWEKDPAANKTLQAFLLRLQGDLEKLGATVYLDIIHLSGDIQAYMQTINRCEQMLLIGTPQLMARASELVDPQRGENNLQSELAHIRGRVARATARSVPPCLIPVLYQGTAETAFPTDLRHGWLNMCESASYEQAMAAPEAGLIPRLFGLLDDVAYRHAYQTWQDRLALSQTARTTYAAGEAPRAFGDFLSAANALFARRQVPTPICYLSHAEETDPRLAARIDTLASDLGRLGLTVWRRDPAQVQHADFVLLIGSPAWKEQVDQQDSPIGQPLRQLDQARQPVEKVPLLFEGTFDSAFPEATKRLLIHDFRQPDRYYREMAQLINPRGLIPQLFEIRRHDKAYADLYRGLDDALTLIDRKQCN
ncbi:hypothetical protein [Chitinimonas arctica]|nr:hypothetical protein [Chitinimonas arctica]